jgi:hypothetical protein
VTDLHDAGGILGCQPEPRLDLSGAGDEECDRIVGKQSLNGGDRVRFRHAQRRHQPDHLARQRERFAAGGEDIEIGTRGEEILDHARAIGQKVFAVVQHQQEAA